MQSHTDFASVHERMVRNVFLNVELLLNDDIRVISEYDVQGLMFLHFRRALLNTGRRAEREREGKVDCVVYEDNIPCAFYEIKTYFKDNEKLSKQHFDHDVDKMFAKLEAQPEARGYILIAGAKPKFKEDALEDFTFIESHLRQDKKEWVPYTLTSGQAVRLRPSQKQHRGQSVVITWEVKVAKDAA